MNNKKQLDVFQTAKYRFYFVVGILCIVNTILSFNLFTILLGLGGIALVLYAYTCLHKQKNILKDLPKPFQYICRMVVVCFMVSFLCIESLVIYQGMQTDDIKTDYIVVLGAAIKNDQPSTALRYRLDEAYEQYKKNPSAKIICSGGKAKKDAYSEAKVMQMYLVKQGVPKSSILLEEKSKNTSQNLQYSYNLVHDANATFLIVTNNFHAYRASILASKIGMHAYSAPSQKLINGFTANYIREYFSVIKSVILD
ncbi:MULTISPECIES: YdcF family protein [unclassified Breznakia]|uniref:YdcF family protein n=1 Tax=unclassified Breznakia TaxID=2623764 RepID=UPI002475DBBC|nr:MULTISPECIES: YdcF family protein [unclassified Breznakia]MDH6367325.1 uncharacterized SAM-binding protein YcdF (DUF218 family) [Breznakia sp. PH1-1]MDH6404527.1 uncharacterized SAM-binding protein YcdF (DUF218 family) [Breznakia sp. PF1-11]MDH6412236.1 uncharacterized SAM-binding protein YcdF (DUF218 family) [Breznakia sp. PFB1-11]MDH6414492.1 uncharacterized SAM-binding protein YcdF (DUF218 family) [Breznakia sp. PFB1-14]MDH6416900.1 uncharacterized SAM-binding protein YcdF (DUF218 family